MARSTLLIIGNKNYSSWSLRPWLAMKVLGIPFEERRIALYGPGSKQQILRHSPSGKLPCLVEEGAAIWDSLAILEYLAERHPQLWPQEPLARARARSISAEMHSGFPELREHMSMNVRKRYPGKGRRPGVMAEIARIAELWTECRQQYGNGKTGGPFLFGAFGAADAMYAPVVLRFRTYEVDEKDIGPVCRAYADAVLALPALREWIADAERETESLPQFEMYG